MKIVQIDGDEVAQHGTLELLILAFQQPTQNLARLRQSRASGRWAKKKAARGGFSSKLKIADGSATSPAHSYICFLAPAPSPGAGPWFGGRSSPLSQLGALSVFNGTAAPPSAVRLCLAGRMSQGVSVPTTIRALGLLHELPENL